VGGGVDSVVQAMQERSKAGVDVNVVVDHRTDTASASFIRLSLEAPDCRVWIWPDDLRLVAPNLFANLHAKCAIADGRQAFVSSANLTDWAMERNIEVGYLVTGGQTPRRLEEHLVALRASGVLQRRSA
jgi:phosphatidylserine/phosphatidylglycerophosphate/cardiolipin synthase-like enzyme